ncbi:hypothetical protein D3C76_1443740 [compost metagenome]
MGIIHVFTNRPDCIQLFLAKQHFFTTCTRTTNVDCREYAALCQTTVQMELHITCTLKLFINDIIHT